MGDQIQQQVLADVLNAGLFLVSVLNNEIMDLSRMEQLSISVRYIHIHKDTIVGVCKPADVEDTTGSGFASVILQELAKLGLNLQFLRGQGYDGASTMSGI